MLSTILLLSPFFIASARATNDWSKPCLSGICEYDLPGTNGTASGTLKIWGPDSAISDITTAAGWQILGCSPDALSQDIRLVCVDEGSGNCANLYTNSATGAVGKLVRLPENCGKSAFAVVTKTYRPQDQSIPVSISASLTRRDGSNTTVQGLSISTDFRSVKASSAGPVNFAIRAANVPGAQGDLDTSQQRRRSNSRVFQRRGLKDFITGAVNDISSLNSFNVNKSTELQPLDVDKSFSLVNQSIKCDPVDATVKIDVDAKAHAVASIGIAATGTIIPPEITSFAVITGLDAEIDGSITLAADASGTLDSGKIPLFEVGVPGLDFPGILTIGPSFKIDAQAVATLDLDIGLTVGLSYTISGAQLVFPPDGNNDQKGSFKIGDTPLKISATPSAKATGTVEAHLIPSLNLGISALGDIVEATIFLELDASASATLSAQAEGSASGTVSKRGIFRREMLAGRHSWMRTAPSEDTSSDDTDSADYTTAVNGTMTKPTSLTQSSSTIERLTVASVPTASTTTRATETVTVTSTPTASDTSYSIETLTTAPTSTAASNTAYTITTQTSIDYKTNSTDSTSSTNSTSSESSSSFSGCFEVDGALDVNAGATGSFFGLFDQTTKVELFSKKFEIFKKCFGSPANTRRSVEAISSRRRSFAGLLQARGQPKVRYAKRAFELECPSADADSAADLVSLVDDVVSAASIE